MSPSTIAHQSHSGCIFFDEKMASLHAIFKYAVDVLIDDQEKKLGTQCETQYWQYRFYSCS